MAHLCNNCVLPEDMYSNGASMIQCKGQGNLAATTQTQNQASVAIRGTATTMCHGAAPLDANN